MRKNGVILLGASVLLLLLGACSAGEVNPKEEMQVFINNMHSNSYDFKGKLHAQVGEDTLEELLVLDGSYVANEGYKLHADVNLPGFDTESDILNTDDKLYYKLPKASEWEPTTDQDLKMLGITYKDSPSDLFQGMKQMVLSVEPTDESNVFKVTLDRSQYEAKTDKEGVMRLPQVDIQSHDLQLELVKNPVVDVEVDLDQNVIRSLTLNYVVKTSLIGQPEQPMNVTYEMTMEHFNDDQTLPEL